MTVPAGPCRALATSVARVLAVLAALAALPAGCSFGIGSAFVGQWRPHDHVAFDACLVDDAGHCVEHKQVTTSVPGRQFWGAIVTVPALGAASVTEAGVRQTRLRLTPSLELLRGWGSFAVGLRAGVQVDRQAASAVPIVALAHLSLTERLSVHAGGGYVPYAQLHGARAHAGAQAVGGLQLGINRVQSENFLVISVDVDATWLDFDRSYQSNGLSAHLGIFF